MLEGPEFEQKIGEVGAVIVDVTPELKLSISAKVEVDLIGEIKKLAAKTATPIDDAAIAWIEKLVKAGNALA
jgi:hypothetical protein